MPRRRTKPLVVGDQMGKNTCHVCGAEVGKRFFDGMLGPFRKARDEVVPGAKLVRLDGILRWACAQHVERT